MRVARLTLLLVAGSGLGSSYVIPTALDRRAAGTQADPIPINFDCTDVEAVCNADCAAILCFGAPNPVQYDAKHASQHRRQDGETLRVFLEDAERRQARGIDIPDSVLDTTGRSAEEVVMANTAQSGPGDILVPTQLDQNTLLGSRVGGQLRHNGVTDGMWYKKNFINFGAKAPYCTALQSNPPDTSICGKDGKDPTDPLKTAIVRMAKTGARGLALFHMMNYAAGDRWTGKLWQ